MKINSLNLPKVAWYTLFGAVVIFFSLALLFLIFPKTSKREQTSLPKATVTKTSSECLANLSTEFLTGQVLMLGLPASAMGTMEEAFKKFHIGGAVLTTAPSSLSDGSIKAFKVAAGGASVPVLIATDEEGGQVQRFASLGKLEAPEEAADSQTVSEAQNNVLEHGKKLKEVGLDMVLGPLADVAAVGDSPLGNRVFSDNPQIVIDYATAYVKGWQQAGLLPTIKHFPGMGSATGNTDFTPATTPSLDRLKQSDFLPYQSLVKSGTAVMVGNQNVPGWFSGPASLSSTVNKYLRDTLGYKDNLIVTDSLTATAVTQSVPLAEAVVRAVTAGNDMVLIVQPDPKEIISADTIMQIQQALTQALNDGTLSKSQLAGSVARKLALQKVDPCSL